MNTEISAPPAAKVKRARFTSSLLTDTQFAYLLVLPLVIILLLIYIYPIIFSFWMSLHQVDIALSIWEFRGLDQYVRALTESAVWHALWVTAIYTVEVTIVTLAISVGGALLLNETFRGKQFVLTVVILPWALSTYATAVIWRYLYSQDIGFFNAVLYVTGIIDRYIPFITQNTAVLAIAVAHSWQLAPLGMYFFLASLQVIPPDLYKAAKIDRLGVFGRFRHVTFPYLRHAILIIMVLVSVEAARAYDVIYFLTLGGPGNSSTTMTWQIYVNTFQAFDFAYGSALSYILLVWIFMITTVYFLMLFGRGEE
jgi:multiple sugar transport system permease protein